MDALSPVKACDPWAVYSAKSFEQHRQKESELTPLQNEILQTLEQHGPMELWELRERLGSDVDEKELQRQFAVLRHLEKVRGEKQGNKVVLRLWD
jgi:predicted transcriptional regulator